MPVTVVALPFNPTPGTPAVVIPASGVSEWVTAVGTGGVTAHNLDGHDVVRDATVANFDKQNILQRLTGKGTTLLVRLKYRKTDAAVTEPLIIRVFAGHDEDPATTPFVALTNHNNEASVLVRTNTSGDSIYQDYAYTMPDNNDHAFDCKGYSHFVVMIERVYPGTDAADAAVEVKII